MSFRQRVRSVWARLTGPRARDVLVIVLSGGAGAIELNSSINDGQFAPWPVLAPCIGVGLIALWWRRRFPLQVFGLGLLTYLIGGTLSTLGFGLLSLAVRRRDRILIAATVLAAAAFWAPKYWDSVPTGLPDGVASTVGALIWTLAGAYIGARRDLLTSLRDRAIRAEQERELRADQARSLERERIAREMHDVVAHKVSLIALQAGGLEVNAGVGPERVEQIAGLIGETARQALADLRQVLGVLRGSGTPAGEDLVPVPGLADVDALVLDSVRAGVKVDFQQRLHDPDAVPQSLGTAIFRVVQEGLTNIHKHARGANCVVLIEGSSQSGLTISVSNAAPVAAGSLLPGSGMGLTGLRERLELIGGTLEAGSNPGGGWTTSAVLPPWRVGSSAKLDERSDVA